LPDFLRDSVDFIKSQEDAIKAITSSNLSGDYYILLLVKFTKKETADFTDKVKKLYQERSLNLPYIVYFYNDVGITTEPEYDFIY